MAHPESTKNHCGENQPHCDDHSGFLMWMKGIASLLTVCACLLGYSVLWQAPNIRLDVAKEVARLDLKDRDIDGEIRAMKGETSNLDRRVARLEGK